MKIAKFSACYRYINKPIQEKFIKCIFCCSFVPFLKQRDDKISSLCQQPRCNHENCDPACVLTVAVWSLLLVLFLKIVSSTEWILQTIRGTMNLEIIRRFRQNIFYQRANIYNEKNMYQAKKTVYS